MIKSAGAAKCPNCISAVLYPGSSLGVCVCGGYPAAEVQSMYSTVPAEWACNSWIKLRKLSLNKPKKLN